jgi:hypothetical protein
MWPFAVATLRSSLQSWAVWALLLFAVAAGWLGLEVSVLALGESASQAPDLILTTAQAFGALLALWIVARHLDEDARSGFPAAADQSLPGPRGRLLGRWLGAFASGAVSAVLIHGALTLVSGQVDSRSHLYLAIVLPPLTLAAWGTLLGCRGGGGLVVAAGGALWFLGHLPWGSASLAAGPLGRAMSGWLPGPIEPADAMGHAAHAAAAATGLLSLALALARRPGAD